MKLSNPDLEFKVIKSICDYGASVESSNSQIGALLLSKLTDEHFGYEPTQAAFQRLVSFGKKRGRILTYAQLLADPSLDEEYRSILKEERRQPVTSIKEADSTIEYLDKYRKARAVYHQSKRNLEVLQESKVDIEALLEENATSITRARQAHMDEPLSSLGKEGEYEEQLEEALDPTDEPLLKVGFKEIDDRNGGVPAEGVMILAGTTSGGKSVLRMNMMKNIYKLNKVDVATVSLEMNRKKETRRMLSSITGIPLWKFLKKVLTAEDRETCRQKLRRFHMFGKKNKCRYSLMCPTRGMSITQLLMAMRPYNFRVIAIDYVGLLEGVSGKDQWQALSEVVRECKIFSTENHCLVIVLCQLDGADDHIRYSKGMLEHADCAWVWNYSKPEQRELKVLPIKQLKARDQELFPFDLREDFEFMRVHNMEETEGAGSTAGSSGGAKRDVLSGNSDVEYETEVS